ncbi:MAG: hypothetical protein J6Q34_04265 [Bacteroidales bacterium]|nr:hypothetical protein [Bacteroidales bacterium]
MREFGSEHPAIVLPDGYFDSLSVLGREICYLRSGREALLAVALDCMKDTNLVLLMPAYCCWSMSAPFEKAGWKVVYYRLTKDLTVDMSYMGMLLEEYNPSAVLTMNFFGIASTREAISHIKNCDPNITVIEDFSHSTFSIKDIFDDEVDYYVSSIRKSVGVCDGSIILSRKKLGIQADPYIEEFSASRKNAQTLKGQYYFSKSEEDKSAFLSMLRNGEEVLNQFDSVRALSPLAAEMLKMINGESIAYARRENMKHLVSLLEGKICMPENIRLSFEGAPFSLPIIVENQSLIQKKLAENCVYAAVLWPLSDEAGKVCENSLYFSEHMLSIPIDQRYSWDDIEDMAKIILKVVNDNE